MVGRISYLLVSADVLQDNIENQRAIIFYGTTDG